MASTDKRSTVKISRCAWCRKVLAAGKWQRERRLAGGVVYLSGICDGCVVLYFGGEAGDAQTFARKARKGILGLADS